MEPLPNSKINTSKSRQEQLPSGPTPSRRPVAPTRTSAPLQSAPSRSRARCPHGILEYLEVAASVSRLARALPPEVEADDAVLSNALDTDLLGDGLHEARLAAPADPGEHLDHTAVMAEASDLLEVVLALEQTHADPNLSTEASVANTMFIGVF